MYLCLFRAGCSDKYWIFWPWELMYWFLGTSGSWLYVHTLNRMYWLTCIFQSLDLIVCLSGEEYFLAYSITGCINMYIPIMRCNCMFISSVRSSNSHPNLLVIHPPTTPLFQITPVLNTGLSLSEPLQLYKGYNAI